MKKPGFLLFLLLLFVSGLCFAQSGYQGKKLSLHGDLIAAPALINATYDKAPGMLVFNNQKLLAADYVLTNYTSIGLDFRFLRTSNLIDYDKRGISEDKLFSRSVGVHYRIFKKKPGNLAPLGKYVQLGADIMSNRVKPGEASAPETPFTTYALRVGVGRNRVLFDRMILSWGWELAHTFTGEGLFGAMYYYEKDPQTMGQFRLLRHNFINFKVGIGMLAF